MKWIKAVRVEKQDNGYGMKHTKEPKQSSSEQDSGPMSNLEQLFAMHIRAMKLPEPMREYRFYPKRKWRLDFAWPDKLLGVEVEGGVWTQGRHLTGVGFTLDCEKYAEAMCVGWRILRVTGSQVENGQAIDWLAKVFSICSRVYPDKHTTM